MSAAEQIRGQPGLRAGQDAHTARRVPNDSVRAARDHQHLAGSEQSGMHDRQTRAARELIPAAKYARIEVLQQDLENLPPAIPIDKEDLAKIAIALQRPARNEQLREPAVEVDGRDTMAVNALRVGAVETRIDIQLLLLPLLGAV